MTDNQNRGLKLVLARILLLSMCVVGQTGAAYVNSRQVESKKGI